MANSGFESLSVEALLNHSPPSFCLANGVLPGIEPSGSSHMEYRSKGHGDKWHFCRNCPDWPADSESFDIVVFADLPPELQPCEKCVALRAAGECSGA